MVTDPTVGNAAEVVTAKLTLGARAWSAAAFIRVVATVIISITAPSERDTAMVVTPKVSTGVTSQFITALLITIVPTVIVAVAHRPKWNTAIVSLTVKLSVVVTAV